MKRIATTAIVFFPAAAFLSAHDVSVSSDIEKYVYPGNDPVKARELQFTPDGTTYLELSDDGHRVIKRETSSGKEVEVVMDVATARDTKLDRIHDFTLSPDGSKLLVNTEPEMIYRRSSRSAHYVYEIRSRLLTPLSTVHPVQQSPVFSPDGRMVAFVDSCDIFIKKLDYGTEVRVTPDGCPGKVINGVPDWTYEEEFATTCSMTWAPDNLTLCFLKYDESAVPSYSLTLYGGGCGGDRSRTCYPDLMTFKYPVAGKSNSRVTLHSYDIETRKTKHIPLADSRIEYIPRIAYAFDSDRLMVTTLNREQNRMELYAVNPRTTTSRSVLVEESKAWLTPCTYEDIALLPSGFVINSSRSGFNHLYLYNYSGAMLRQLTSGSFDVTAYYGHDAAKDIHYYQSTAAGPVNRVVSRVDAKGRVIDISPREGISSARFAPVMNFYTIEHSSVKEAPSEELYSAPAGKKLRGLVDNTAYAQTYFSAPVTEFTTVNASGIELNMSIVKPVGFDAARRYPVIVYQYSGPGSQEVLNRWQADWRLYFAEKGYIVVTVDPRGTGGRGREFMDVVYRDLGHYETVDLIAAAGELAKLPYVDGSRMGLFGWSYGGYEALMCATSPDNPFKAVVAVAPVTDWHFYDTVYAERYMTTPQMNERGYSVSAPLNRVKDLNCRLLVMWGTADDNVHPENSIEFAAALQSAGKFCDMMLFPNQNHSIKTCGMRKIVYGRMLDYFNRNL